MLNISKKWLAISISISILGIFAIFENKSIGIHDLSEAANLQKDLDYYPLEIGNAWEFENHFYGKEIKTPQRYSIIITSKVDIGNEMILYKMQNDKEFLIKTKEGIVTPSGVLLVKYPLTLGAEWVSAGREIVTRSLFRIENIGFSVTVKGKTYKNCLKIVTKSGFHTVMIKDQFTKLALESQYVYAPNVGPVLIESFEVMESGEKKLAARQELITFKTKQPATTELLPPAKQEKLVDMMAAFKFPQRGFWNPLLSPDDKWLVYRKDFEEKIYYTKRERSDQNVVPLFPKNEKYKVESIGTYRWSPDGKTLAFMVGISPATRLVLVDFSGNKPHFIELFEIHNGQFAWIQKNLLVYIDKFGNIMQKSPGKEPERVVFFRSSYSSRARTADEFQVASNGALVYRIEPYGEKRPWNNDIYLTNLQTLNTQTLIFSGIHVVGINISPNGQYVLLSFRHWNADGKEGGKETLIDLNLKKDILTFPMLERAAWSPDGRKLAYLETKHPLRDRNDPSKVIWENPHFFILDLKTGQKRDYGLGVSREFNWTPDGKHIIYSMKYAHESLTIYKMGVFIMSVADGKEIGQLTKISANPAPVMSHSGKYIIWEALNGNTFFIAENPFQSEMNIKFP